MPSINREELDAKVEAVHEQVVAWRRHVHAHPDLSYHEEATAEYVASELRKLDPESKVLTVRQPLPNAVVADLRGGGGDSKTIIALRADIDALPVNELADEPFKSTKKDVMHACGHDGHTAMLLGAAALLVMNSSRINGTVRFLFQPAEELPPGGALELLKAGCLEGVTMAFSEHIMPLSWAPTGTVVIREGALFSSCDSFTIRIIGKGGHGSMPELSTDPVAVACQCVTALQQMVTRRLPSAKAPVLSICNIKSSSDSFNVIPDEVELKGTLRCTDNTVRADTLRYMEEVVDGVTRSMGAKYEIAPMPGIPLGVNAPEPYAAAQRAIRQVLANPDDLKVAEFPLKGSEDYAFIAEVVPSNYCLIGSYNEEKGCTAPNHNPKFKVDEECLKVGVKVHYAMIHELLMQ